MPQPSRPTRARVTRHSVHVWDRAAGIIITLGGLAVLAAVLGIGIFLVLETVPLVSPGRVQEAHQGAGGGVLLEPPLAIYSDEYRRSFGLVTADGVLRITHLPDGKTVSERRLTPEGRRLTSFSFDTASGLTALGLDDGSIQLGTIGFTTDVVDGSELPGDLLNLAPGSSAVRAADGELRSAVVERVNEGSLRVITPIIDLQDPVPLESGVGPVVAVDYRTRAGEDFLVALRADGTAAYDLVRTIRPLGGGPARVHLTHHPIPLQIPAGHPHPRLIVTGDGSSVYAIWQDGEALRFASDSPGDRPIVLAERTRLADEGRAITMCQTLLGGLTLMIGDDSGELRAYFGAVDPAAPTPDHVRTVLGHTFLIGTAPVSCFGISPRDRTMIAGDRSGRLTVINVTSRKMIASMLDAGSPPVAAAITPKMDGLLAVYEDGSYRSWDLDAGHPEASIGSLFGKVHYEGQLTPSFAYQSSSGEDAAEAKLSLTPLIFGTLKATVVAMLFAVPIAVMAAVYTSEFMHRGVRRFVKPAVELMASLPTVVLGFIAAIIAAPFVRDHLAAVLVGFTVLPLGTLIFAHLWQLVPSRLGSRVAGFGPRAGHLMMSFIVLAMLTVISIRLGPVVERSLFVPSRADRLVMAGAFEPVPAEQWPSWVGGRREMSPDDERSLRANGMYFRAGGVVRPLDAATPAAQSALADASAALRDGETGITRWLDGGIGGPAPGWILLLALPVTVVIWLVQSRILGTKLTDQLSLSDRRKAAAIELGRAVGVLVLGLSATVGLAHFLGAVGLDPRDSVFGTFSQRNTLVVGIIMGFAVVPLIYTISEDAMRSVPAGLRSASLGTGATPWQTAVRIVLPVAGSGIFSAIMIGLGRAAGETMIVVMATGNTPSMDMNIFAGFRTLAANIAVELPEAVEGSTHYRVLFLCGLTLFALTFVVNTTAEIVRQRFRKRNAAL